MAWGMISRAKRDKATDDFICFQIERAKKYTDERRPSDAGRYFLKVLKIFINENTQTQKRNRNTIERKTF